MNTSFITSETLTALNPLTYSSYYQ